MSELEPLRNLLTDGQREILTTVWNHFLEHKNLIPKRLLDREHSLRPELWKSVRQLGGAIIFESEVGHSIRYDLTFLGILLTEDAVVYEQLLANYLAYVYQKCYEDPERTEVSSREVATDLKLDQEQVSLLHELISKGGFHRGATFSADEWNIVIPYDVENYAENQIEYIHKCAIGNYDPDVPVAVAERASYEWRKIHKSVQKEAQPEPAGKTTTDTYVDETRIADLRKITSSQHDLTRLIKLCEELNICYAKECYLAVAMLTRAVLDHVPPIFGETTFAAVANNYAGSKSFKESMQNLENSCRKIANAHLHVRVRNKEVLPAKNQVNFIPDFDVLLAEIVRIL